MAEERLTTRWARPRWPATGTSRLKAADGIVRARPANDTVHAENTMAVTTNAAGADGGRHGLGVRASVAGAMDEIARGWRKLGVFTIK